MRISTSKSKAMVLRQKRIDCPLWVGGESLPQLEEFRYLGVLFMSKGKLEREIDRQIGSVSAVMETRTQSMVGEERAEPESKPFHLQVNLHPNFYLW